MSETTDPTLTADEFAEIQRALDLSDRELGRWLGLKESSAPVTIRRVKSGELPCSGPMAAALLSFAAGFRPRWIPARPAGRMTREERAAQMLFITLTRPDVFSLIEAAAGPEIQKGRRNATLQMIAKEQARDLAKPRR